MCDSMIAGVKIGHREEEYLFVDHPSPKSRGRKTSPKHKPLPPQKQNSWKDDLPRYSAEQFLEWDNEE